MNESPNKFVAPRDGVIVGDIHISQNMHQKINCGRCNSVSPEIISCKQCKKLFACGVCKIEVETIRKKLIGTFPEPLHNLVEVHLDRACETCITNYSKINDPHAISGIWRRKKNLFDLCGDLFDEENYVWPEMENLQWPPFKYEMIEEEQFFWKCLADMGDFNPMPFGVNQPLSNSNTAYPLSEYLDQRLQNLETLMWESHANFKDAERKAKKPVPFRTNLVSRPEELLTLQYSEIGGPHPKFVLELDSFFQNPIILHNDLTASERYPYSSVKEILFKQGWTFDFEIEICESTHQKIPKRMMFFFKQ